MSADLKVFAAAARAYSSALTQQGQSTLGLFVNAYHDQSRRMRRLSNVSALPAITGIGLLAALGCTAVAPAHATQASFTIQGTVTSQPPALGYAPGAAVSFTWVLDDAAVKLARFSGPNCTGCFGSLAWFQDFFSDTPQLWQSITGSGLSGAWQPPADRDDGSVSVGVGTSAPSFSQSFQMLANSQTGFNSGLQVNGLPVTALQMNAVYLGLDLVPLVGAGNALTTTPPPDPTALLLALAGTYAVDRNFSELGSIWASGPGGGQFTFRVDSLTISAVPEPASWALMLAGMASVAWVVRRRTRHGGTVAVAAN